MGKRGPKPQFTDVVCPNKDCKLYGVIGQGNVVGNGTYISRGEKTRDIFAMNVVKHFATIQALFITISAKMKKLLN
jgi:hypothetical protein